ncbi:CDGSH iron-sulfur domain-containing protein [Synechococcus sp. CBW1006]|uniref:CDGSH iron-sulfur domain-containing protein n=1 Tax=Synechococcus sp. CBW1006 TaxID=1353138 RepID=UPI001E385187|nr:CDGSH iron-sulfur domain-containing protein [Synechococcus sp. CBW1006]
MTTPTVAASTPITVSLEEGTKYFYCACGRSSDQPFCDGSHQGSGFTPLAFVAEANGRALLCRCKQTATPPYCDGTHARVPADRVGTTFAVDEDGDNEKPESGGSPVGRTTQARPRRRRPTWS